MPSIFAILFIGFAAIAYFFPSALTGPTQHALKEAAAREFGLNTGGRALALAALLLQGPYLGALIAAYMASSAAQRTIGAESDRGGLELLLSAPYSPTGLSASLLLSCFVMTVLNWFLIVVPLILIGLAGGYSLGCDVRLMLRFVVIGITLPLPMALWSAVIALILSARFPKLMRISTGTSGNVVQMAAVFPALLFFILMTLVPGVNLISFALVAFVVSIAGSIFCIAIFLRELRPELLLDN